MIFVLLSVNAELIAGIFSWDYTSQKIQEIAKKGKLMYVTNYKLITVFTMEKNENVLDEC